MIAEQHFQVGVKAVAQNDKGEILLLAQKPWGGLPTYWDLPGGRMEPGEGFLQTLRRELQEEIGVDIADIEDNAKHLATVLSNMTIPVDDENVPLILIAYRVALASDAVITIDPNSSEQEYEWCLPVEAAERLQRKYPPNFCNAIKEL